MFLVSRVILGHWYEKTQGDKMSLADDVKANRPKPGPCPKCGGISVLEGERFCGYESCWVRCTKCGHRNGGLEGFDDTFQAVRYWNGAKQ